jgi:uncharacterized protein YndB with AHSA1/START domain
MSGAAAGGAVRTWVLRVAVVIVVAVVSLLVAGVLLPRDHVATTAATLRQPPESVWAVVRDLGGLPGWWSEVATSERVADPAGREVWCQTVGGFPMTFVVTEAVAPLRLVAAIDAPSGSAFGGTWTYALTPVAGGTRVIVTEAGWIANPLYRVIANIMGLHGTLDGYLVALGARFGEAVTPEHLAR